MAVIFGYLWTVIVSTLTQLFVLMGPGLILAVIMHLVAGWLDRLATRAIGWKVYYALFSFMGTIIHELGHAFFNIIFGHKITRIKLTNRDPSQGETAHVAYAYDPQNLYQRIGIFFSAIGPILFGTMVVYGMAILLLGRDEFEPLKNVQTTMASFSSIKSMLILLTSILGGALDAIARIFTPANFANWRFWVFLYLAFSIGSNISLSPSDLRGAATGFISLVTVVFVVNLLTLWAGDFISRFVQWISRFNGVFYAVMLITLFLCLLGAALMLLIIMLRAILRR